MENASKALLIAAGILLALIILSLLIYMTNTTSRMAKAQDEKTEAEQLAAFNREYEAYNKTKMYGTDVITVYNKAKNNNEKKEIFITIKVYDKNGNEISISYESEFKNKIFECSDLKYSNGRVSEMEFIEKA